MAATGDHAEVDRLRALVTEFGRSSGLGEDDLRGLDIAASMIAVKGLSVLDITEKPGPLTPEDRARMKEITDIWADFAGQVDLLRVLGVSRILETYTEHWDGRGQPAGLSGEDIPLGARVLAVCYHYNGMTSDRPYRPALSPDRAASELSRMSATVLDPGLVERFLALEAARPTPGVPDVPGAAPAVVQAGPGKEAAPGGPPSRPVRSTEGTDLRAAPPGSDRKEPERPASKPRPKKVTRRRPAAASLAPAKKKKAAARKATKKAGKTKKKR
ncbi:MAG: HD-GYP domain-containing protein [Planctomycetota bacterium]|jgi:hypothetical protein